MRTDSSDRGRNENGFWAVVRVNLTSYGQAVADRFDAWYSDEHVPTYVARSGFRSGHRLRRLTTAHDEGRAEHEYLAAYRMDEIGAFNDALAAGPPWGPWHADIDRIACDWERTYYRELSRVEVGAGSGAVWAIVKTDLAPGADVAEFQRWYDEVHLPEIAANDGFHRAWRLEVAPDANDLGPRRQRFWAVYDVDSPETFAAARDQRFVRGVPAWDGIWTEHVRDVEIAFYHRQFDIDHVAAARHVAGTEEDR